MTAVELLRQKASKLRHALDRGSDIFDSNHNKVGTVEPTHHLTCERCKLEKEANELEQNSNTN